MSINEINFSFAQLELAIEFNNLHSKYKFKVTTMEDDHRITRRMIEIRQSLDLSAEDILSVSRKINSISAKTRMYSHL